MSSRKKKEKKKGRASDPDNKIWNSRNWNNLGIYNRRRKKGNAGASNLLSTPFPARARTTLAIEVSFPFSDRLIFYRFPGAYPIASLFVCLSNCLGEVPNHEGGFSLSRLFVLSVPTCADAERPTTLLAVPRHIPPLTTETSENKKSKRRNSRVEKEREKVEGNRIRS